MENKWVVPFWLVAEFLLCLFFNFLILNIFTKLGITLAYVRLNSFFVLATGYRLAFILLISTAYWYMLERIESLKKIHQQETLIFKTKLINKHLKNAMLEEQLSKQKASIVPHFLFNTLHVLYHQLRTEKPQEAQHLLSLSEMMQYNLSPLDQQYKIPLSHELAYLKNYIALRQLERNYALKLNINISDEVADELLIIPLVMATLIENVFHHGDLYQPKHPALISIGLKKNKLLIWIKNKKRAHATTKNGIGIANMLSRLAHFYPGQHQYTSTSSRQQYIQKLYIYL